MILVKITCILALVPICISQTPVDPNDANLNTIDLLKKYNHPYEVHEVPTKDGYVLVLHRILSMSRNSENPKVIFLNHGLVANSYHWIARGPSDALGYVLSNAGYDVWMTNTRGNGVSMSADEGRVNNFWNYSLDDIGKYDTPAAMDYVLAHTKQTDLTFIGHSQGCTEYYVMCLEKPEYETKINKFIALAPLFSWRYGNIVLQLVKIFENFKTIRGSYFDQGKEMSFQFRTFCETFGMSFCRKIYMLGGGSSKAEIPLDFLKIVYKKWPANSSSKNFIQIMQWMKKKHIAKFDYGSKLNRKYYGSTKPSIYNLTLAKLNPKYVFYGSQDNLVNPKSIEYALKQMSNVKQVFEIEGYGHNDFTVGWSVLSKVNLKILNILENE